MSEKLCVFCPHFQYSEIRAYNYSTLPGGTEGGFTCMKGHYVERRPDDTDEFRELILRAETCPNYEVEH